MNYFISIDREEFNPESYRAVEVHQGKEPCRRFSSGNPVKDWKDAMEVVKANPGPMAFSSSVDYFMSEVPGYAWARDEDGYLVIMCYVSLTA